MMKETVHFVAPVAVVQDMQASGLVRVKSLENCKLLRPVEEGCVLDSITAYQPFKILWMRR